MSLTLGTGPFSRHRDVTLNFEPPARAVLVEPLRRRVQAVRDGNIVIDSDDVKLVHVTGTLPVYAFPAKDVHVESEPHPDADDLVTVKWDAVDAWYEEDERVFVHPRDPYHRIDTFSTSRRVEARVNGTLLASSTRTLALYETGLPIRYYFPRADVESSLLELSDYVTQCAYKGTARHWHAKVEGSGTHDVAWTYDHEVWREGEAIRHRVAFYSEKIELTVDGDPYR
jgi:uncharacterized protein (DUF427 family)